MITVVAKLQAQPGKEQELRAACEEMIRNVKQHEAGKAVTYSLHTSDTDPTIVMFYEQYADKDANEAHRTTDHMKAFGGAIGGLVAGRPVIERYTWVAGV